MGVCCCSLAGTRACMFCSNGSIHTITYPFNYELFKDMLEYNRKHTGTSTSTSLKDIPKRKYNFTTTISNYK